MNTSSPYRIIFMGTPDLAAICLRKLVSAGQENHLWDVVGIISQPDKPKGRNLVLQPTAVKAAAMELGIECYQPTKACNPESLDWIRSKKTDLIIVTAYGQILTQALLDIPRLGCLNIHTSLLPRYRGAAPIQCAILDGCTETGVTLMKVVLALDAGDIISVRKTPITAEDNAETLHDRLANLGGTILVETLPDFFAGKIQPIPQSEEGMIYAHKITKEDGHLDWTQSASALDCRIRAFTPWPGAYSYLIENGKKILLKIWNATPTLTSSPNVLPGTILKAEGDTVEIACGIGTLSVHTLQREGKKRLPTREFLAGTPLQKGTVLQ